MKPPKHVYNSAITLKVCTAVDKWQAPTFASYTITGVNFQNAHETRLNYDNTEVVLRALVFIDSDYSTPHYDLWALQKQSEANGQAMHIEAGGDDYEVLIVDRIENQYGRFDHWELSLK